MCLYANGSLWTLRCAQAKGNHSFEGLDLFRPPECDSARPIKVGKRSRWRQRRCSSAEVIVAYAASKPDDPRSESERMRSHSVREKCCHLVPLEKKKKKRRTKKKRIMLIVCFTCSGVSAAGSVLQTSSCLLVVRRCYHSASLTLNKQAEKVHFTVVCPEEEYL